MQRHDRESGDLYGLLPLARGLPVALTDHIDRSADKQLLRGRVGKVHSWVLGEGEDSQFVKGIRILKKLPKLVLVKFCQADGKEVDWHLPSLSEKGLYPIAPRQSAWFLDKGRKHPVLKIKRKQLPLAPAFAMTAHAAQGQTCKKGCIVDLSIGKGSNPIGSYVSMTRVTKREDLLIYRPFRRKPFAAGQKDGPCLLLKHLRGEKIDWEAVENRYTPKRRCRGCNSVVFKDQYASAQWNRKDEISFCADCVATKHNQGTPFRCNTCERWKTAECFLRSNLAAQCLHKRVCLNCVEQRQCIKCKEWLDETSFSPGEWSRAQWECRQGSCLRCMKRYQMQRQCGVCQNWMEHAFFEDRQWQACGEQKRSGHCKNCRSEKEETLRQCKACEIWLQQAFFTKGEWARAEWKGQRGKCLKCMKRNQDQRPCGVCYKMLPKKDFEPRQWQACGQKKRTGKCIRCAKALSTTTGVIAASQSNKRVIASG